MARPAAGVWTPDRGNPPVTPGGPSAAPAAARDEQRLGPWSTLLGQAFVVGALLYLFGVWDFRPAIATLVVVPAIGCVLLAPREVLLRARVSLLVLALVAWLLLSWTWSDNPSVTLFVLRVDVPLLLAAVVVTGLLSDRALILAAQWAVRLGVVITIVVLLVDVSSRTNNIPGWHGGFIHKNPMAAFVVFGLATSLTFDRALWRWPTVVAGGVLLIGSQSVTGMSGALVVVALALWFTAYRRTASRRDASATMLLASGVLAVVVGIALVSNLTAVAGWWGKDATFNARTQTWSAAIDVIGDRPLIGYGPGAFIYSNDPSPATLEVWRLVGDETAHAHNGLLQVAGSIGVIGLGLVLAVLVTNLLMASRLVRRAPKVAVWALLLTAAQLTMSIAEPLLLGPWLFLAIVLRAPLMRATQAQRADRNGATSVDPSAVSVVGA